MCFVVFLLSNVYFSKSVIYIDFKTFQQQKMTFYPHIKTISPNTEKEINKFSAVSNSLPQVIVIQTFRHVYGHHMTHVPKKLQFKCS